MTATLGVPTEVKGGEHLVTLDPHTVAMLTGADLKVLVEFGAGVAAGYSDAAHQSASADLLVKVKEPPPSKWRQFRHGLKFFGYLHLAAASQLVRALQETGVEAHAFETVTENRGLLLLAPTSDIARCAAAIMGMYYLAQSSSTLLGGSAGVRPARVVVIGTGVTGSMAARGARGMDVEVTGTKVNLERLRQLQCDGTVSATLVSSPSAIGEILGQADLDIGSALAIGARAPLVVTTGQVGAMREGSVIVDLAIDHGGCIETSRPTSLSNPAYEQGGVIYCYVTNVPGQFPPTASRALSAAIAPRERQLAFEPHHPAPSGSLNVSDVLIIRPSLPHSTYHHSLSRSEGFL